MTQIIRIEQSVLDHKRRFVLDVANLAASDGAWAFGASRESVILVVVSL